MFFLFKKWSITFWSFNIVNRAKFWRETVKNIKIEIFSSSSWWLQNAQFTFEFFSNAKIVNKRFWLLKIYFWTSSAPKKLSLRQHCIQLWPTEAKSNYFDDEKRWNVVNRCIFEAPINELYTYLFQNFLLLEEFPKSIFLDSKKRKNK